MKYLLILSMLLCVSCRKDDPNTPKVASTVEQGSGESELVRYQDKDNSVICYRVRGYDGLSCIQKDKK